MKPQQLARLLSIKPVTLRRWAREEFREFLSPSAQGGNSLQRSFDERDIRILAWVARMRLQNIAVADIQETLKASQASNWRDLPPLPNGMEHDEPVPMMPVDTALAKVEANKEKYELYVTQLLQERKELKAQIGELKGENAELRRKYYAVTEQLIELNKRLADMLDDERKRSR